MPAARNLRLAARVATGALVLAFALLALAPPAAARSRRGPRYHQRTSRWSYAFQIGANTYLRNFAGVAQLALLRNYAREHYGVVQFAFFSNRGRRAISLVQFAGWNAQRQGFFLLQVGGLNQFRETFSVLQVGGLNEARAYLGGVQVGVANDMRHVAAVAQVGGANFINGDSYLGLQIGGLNWSAGRRTDIWTVAQLGAVNIFDDGAELYALLQVGLYNSSDDDTSTILGQYGLINRVKEGTYRGLFQVAVGFNQAENFTGIAQIAPSNYVGDRLYGAQIGLVNAAREVNGVQIGLFNYARTLHGVQIGLVNISRHGGLPFCVIGNIGF